VPDEVDAGELDRAVRAELRSLARPTAAAVAGHLVAAGRLVDEDPETALAHAVAARRLASRIPAVREAVGIAAYHAEQWQTAVAELRTYHRMTGRQSHLALLADCERALGRPERAIDIFRSAKRDELDRDDAVELLIVAAGARRDLGQDEAALSMLQVPELKLDTAAAARLRYAYADGLLDAGRTDDAREWFARAVEADRDGTTDAAERLLELDGVMLDEDEDEDEDDEEADPGADDDLPEDRDLAEADRAGEADLSGESDDLTEVDSGDREFVDADLDDEDPDDAVIDEEDLDDEDHDGFPVAAAAGIGDDGMVSADEDAKDQPRSDPPR
jgi:tetratricopeptide (TPR) repeat protein